MGTVTATISTKNRHGSTLPLAIQAVLAQTVLPKQLVVYDDNDTFTDPNGHPAIMHLLQLAMALGCQWFWLPGQKKGQVANHQTALDKADTDFIWRLDDDNIPAPDCLAALLDTMGGNNIGAVGGLVLDPLHVGPRPSFVTGKIADIHCPFNLQWYRWAGTDTDVDHLYSTFLYRVAAGKKAGGYHGGLSPVGHREETMFSHAIKRTGMRCVVTPKALTWHLRAPTGGIRSYSDGGLWAHDDDLFDKQLAVWGVTPVDYRFIVLDNGIGDHIVFRSVLPEIIAARQGAQIILAVCYPELFDGVAGVRLASIADARAAFGDLGQWDVYAWCAARNWQQPLAAAFRGMYL